MKIRLMSNYDIAKNLIKIIIDSAEYSKKNVKSMPNANKSVYTPRSFTESDSFVKTTEKVGK